MAGQYSYLIAILIIPIVMFLFLGLMTTKLSKKVAGTLGTIGLGACLVIGYTAALTYFASGNLEPIKVLDTVWIDFSQIADGFSINLGIYLDPISAMMLIVVTTISFLVHLYSNGYMDDAHLIKYGHEADGGVKHGFQRYFAFLSLFTFSMLGLVLATNIFQMYLFWELVGVSSYLLIGFYYTDPAAIHASKKAFITTRFADLGFLIGILILSYYTQTFDFDKLINGSTSVLNTMHATTFLGCSVLCWAMTCIFIGGAGKSAMFPLHIWLPDAMEGPTPVSALIHAATMVVAGVYLVARLFPLYLIAEGSLVVITIVGAFTAFYAAAIACAQTDIKRILAFSTISQIAFMITSLGVARPEYHEGVGYMASMFHLFTHAMFKACLFLVAGAVIYRVHSNESGKMGGLHKYMPIASIACLVGCLAISGIFPFAGFFSKDEILVAAYANNMWWGLWMSMVAGMTAFYMFRLYYLVFWWDKPDYEAHGHHAPKEAPMVMTLPLIILSVATCVIGFLPFSDYITYNHEPLHAGHDWTVIISSTVIALIGIGLATVLYFKKNDKPARMANAARGLWTAANKRFYMDELYMFITHNIIFQTICRPIAWFDRAIIDGTMNMFANITNAASYAIRKFQSGSIQSYVWVYLLGALAIAVVSMLCLI